MGVVLYLRTAIVDVKIDLCPVQIKNPTCWTLSSGVKRGYCKQAIQLCELDGIKMFYQCSSADCCTLKFGKELCVEL